MNYVSVDKLKAARYLASGFIGLRRFEGMRSDQSFWESVELLDSMPVINDEQIVFELTDITPPIDCSKISKLLVSSNEAKEDHLTAFSMFEDLYPFISMEVIGVASPPAQAVLLPETPQYIEVTSHLDIDPTRLPAIILALSRSIIDFYDCLGREELQLDLSRGLPALIVKHVNRLISSDRLAATSDPLAEKLLCSYCTAVTRLASPISIDTGYLIEFLSGHVEVSSQKEEESLSRFIANLRDVSDGMKALSQMADDRYDLTLRRAIVLAILCSSYEDLLAIQNSYRLHRDIVRLATFLIRLKQRQAYFYKTLSDKGKDIVDLFFRASSLMLGSHTIDLNINVSSRSFSFDQDAVLYLMKQPVLTAPVQQSAGLKQVLGALESGGYIASANKQGDPTVSRTLSSGFCLDVVLKITNSGSQQKLIIQSVPINSGEIYRKPTLIVELVNAASQAACAIYFDSTNKTIEIKREQLITTLDAPELTDHIMSIERGALAVLDVLTVS